MRRKRISLFRFKRNRKAISPAISTVIVTAAIVSLLLVAIVFANDFLNTRLAENEFEATKQFMQTVGLQIDDIAWTIGRTQTIRYASNFGFLRFESVALNYTIFINDNVISLASYTTGVLIFNMPIEHYNLANNYFERVFPSSDGSFIQEGPSAPVNHVFVIEKLPMADGDFIRIVVAPSIRMLNSTVSTGGVDTNYFKFYLPTLSSGTHRYRSQSVTLVGGPVSVETQGSISKIEVQVDFPKSALGFNEDFFHFESTSEVVTVLGDSVLEFYTGELTTSVGLHG